MTSSSKQKPQSRSKKFLLSFFPFYKYVVSGTSMSPTLQEGKTVLVNRIVYLFKKPNVGDIVAASISNKVFIKRITSINDDRYFLLGDNTADSFDSRKFGMIKRSQIIGKVIIL